MKFHPLIIRILNLPIFHKKYVAVPSTIKIGRANVDVVVNVVGFKLHFPFAGFHDMESALGWIYNFEESLRMQPDVYRIRVRVTKEK